MANRSSKNVEADISIFDTLQRQEADPKFHEDRLKAIAERQRAEHEATRKRMSDLIRQNSTLPIDIRSVRIFNAPHTRQAFLDRIFSPITSTDGAPVQTLQDVIRKATAAADKLRKFDIFHPDLSLSLDGATANGSATTQQPLDIYFHARERSRLALKTGTDLGNVETSAYFNVLLRNLFGGAESLNLNASTGTRTRSSYNATFEAPVLSDPDRKVGVEGFQSCTSNFWASHEEAIKGGRLRYAWRARGGAQHQIAYTGTWRQITGLGDKASSSVRADAGDSVKSSIAHTWTRDTRDTPLLPSSGLLLKSVSEVAGWGPLGGDVAWWKTELESQGATTLPIPGIKGVTLSAGLRGGVLYPLGLGVNGPPQASRISDRFQLGGPNDVRGFKLGGLGPRDGGDALGGDVYAAGSVAVLFPLPRVGPESPLRLQIFANGGRLLALNNRRQTQGSDDRGFDGSNTQQSVYKTIAELGNGLPSIAAGIGLVYAHPVARFELNFGLPLVLRRDEEGRKGLQFGVGINFL